MGRIQEIFYIVICILLVVAGISTWTIAMPYIKNKVHDNASPVIQYSVLKNDTCHIFLKFETLDAFIATNPINVSVQAEPICLDTVKSIRLTFDGASEYYPNSYPGNETFADLFTDSINANSNILTIEKDNRFETYVYNNATYGRFSGQITNIKYPISGSYNVEAQFEFANGTVRNEPYVISNAITVSPSENLLQIKANNIMIGLGWIGVSLPLVLAGLVGLLEVGKDLFFKEKRKDKQPFACVGTIN